MSWRSVASSRRKRLIFRIWRSVSMLLAMACVSSDAAVWQYESGAALTAASASARRAPLRPSGSHAGHRNVIAVGVSYSMTATALRQGAQILFLEPSGASLGVGLLSGVFARQPPQAFQLSIFVHSPEAGSSR